MSRELIETETLKQIEAALVRGRQAFVNAIELGIIAPNYVKETRDVITEMTLALVKMGAEKAI